MKANQLGWNNLHTHFSRWVQAYVVQSAQVHNVENQNKTQQQEGLCALPIPHDEAFDRVCGVLNKVYQMKRTDWDLSCQQFDGLIEP